MALIISLPLQFSNPSPDTPRVPDIDTGLQWDLNADSLSGAEGSTVSSWTAMGSAPTTERAFTARPTGWSFPTLSLTAGPGATRSVEFNAIHQIRMAVTAATEAQPITIAGVARVDNYDSSAFSRIWGGSTAGPISVAPVANNLQLLGGGTAANTGVAPSGWFAFVAVFSGSASTLTINDIPTITGLNPGTASYNGGGIGGSTSSSSTPGSGLVGGVKRMRRYNRALSASDARSLNAYFMQLYGIQ